MQTVCMSKICILVIYATNFSMHSHNTNDKPSYQKAEQTFELSTA